MVPLEEAPENKLLFAGRDSSNCRVPSLLKRDPGPWTLTPVKWSQTNALGIAISAFPSQGLLPAALYRHEPCECFSTTGCGQLSRCSYALLQEGFQHSGELHLLIPGQADWTEPRNVITNACSAAKHCSNILKLKFPVSQKTPNLLCWKNNFSVLYTEKKQIQNTCIHLQLKGTAHPKMKTIIYSHHAHGKLQHSPTQLKTLEICFKM